MANDLMEIGVALGAQEHPERLAVNDEFGASVTYTELDTLVNKTINALYARGLEPGDVIALLLDNRVETVLLQQVAYRGGFLYTPLNPRLKHGELEYLLEDSEAKFLFADRGYLDVAKELVAEDDGRLISVGADPDRTGGLNSLDLLIADASSAPVQHQFGSVMSYTSGTTGRPKAVVRERSTPDPEVLQKMLRFGERLGFDPEHDRHLTTAPLHHGGPLISAMHVLNMQGSVYLLRRFDPETVLATIERERITSAYMVPTMYHRMLRLPDETRHSYDLSSLQSVMHTGAPCPPDLKRRMIEWLGPIVYECYAATEGFGTYTVCTSEQWLEHPGTVGKPEHDIVTIRDEEGNELPTGEIGHVYTATLPGVKPFVYRGDEEKTRAAYGPAGDYTVGDMGYLDEEGFLYLTGRASDMIISGGVNIYPAEVEQALLQHEAAKDAAVFGIPDEEWGESVVAVVQVHDVERTSPGLADDLMSFCRERIASYKCPREIHLMNDIGREPSGKLRKNLLRDRFESTDSAR